MVGLHEPNSGDLILDKKYKMNEYIDSWRNNIGYIPQNILLMDTSIKKNIALGISTDQIDSNKIDEVLKISELSQFVNNLPNGVDTMTGEGGVKLSGGQRQRIGIARALYNEPKILILDEATSSLDSMTEKKVMNSIYKMKHQLTMIIVSHRLNTLEFCDKLYEVKSKNLKKLKITNS